MFSKDFHQLTTVLSRKIKGETITDNDLLSLNQKLVKAHRCNIYLKPNKNVLSEIENQKNKRFLMQQLKISAETVRLQNIANQNNIRLIFPKGIILDELLFDGKKDRISRDVDFLIHPNDIEKMHLILIKMGFKRIYPEFELSTDQLKATTKILNQFAYYHPKKKVMIELHWRLFRNKKVFDIPFDILWLRKSTINIDGNELNYLPKDVLAIFLIIHGSLHGWERIFWLVDLALLFKKYNDEDWQNLKTIAEKHHVIKPVQQTLFLLKKWFNLEFKSGITSATEKEISFYDLKKFVIDTDHYIFTNEAQKNKSQTIFYAAKMISKNRVYFFHLFNHSVLDFKTVPLPRVLYWVYPIIHPITALIRKSKHTD